MKKIVLVYPAFTEAHRNAITELAALHGYETSFCESSEEACEEIRDAECGFGFSTDLVRAGKELRWFCAASAGVDAFLAPGVITNEEMLLSNSSGAYGVTLSEHAVMLTLELLRKQMVFNRIVAERGWDKSPMFRSIKDARITILGTGDLGTETAKRLKGFEPARIIGVNARGKNPAPEYYDEIVVSGQADEILPETDILLMFLPGSAQTYHFMDARRLALLPGHAILVNLGRGTAVDEAALYDALENEQIAAAALDVFEVEPLPQDSPLWDCKNLLITPHVAGNASLGYTVDKNARMYLEDLDNYLNGRPLTRLVNREQGY